MRDEPDEQVTIEVPLGVRRLCALLMLRGDLTPSERIDVLANAWWSLYAAAHPEILN